MTCHFGVRFWIREKNTNYQHWEIKFELRILMKLSFAMILSFEDGELSCPLPLRSCFCVTVKGNYDFIMFLCSV